MSNLSRGGDHSDGLIGKAQFFRRWDAPGGRLTRLDRSYDSFQRRPGDPRGFLRSTPGSKCSTVIWRRETNSLQLDRDLGRENELASKRAKKRHRRAGSANGLA